MVGVARCLEGRLGFGGSCFWFFSFYDICMYILSLNANSMFLVHSIPFRRVPYFFGTLRTHFIRKNVIDIMIIHCQIVDMLANSLKKLPRICMFVMCRVYSDEKK